MTTEQQIHAVSLATAVRALADKAIDGPLELRTNARGNYIIVSKSPWKRSPPGNMGGEWNEDTVVCEIKGGVSDVTEAAGHLLAIAFEAAPALGGVVTEQALMLHRAEPSVTDVPLPPEVGNMRASGAMQQFFTTIANAVDDLLEEAGYGQVSDRNADPIDRLLTGDGLAGDGREQRHEILAAVAAVLDPAADRERMKKLPPKYRLPMHARPKRQDFIDSIPEQVRAGLHGEPTQATDAELTKDVFGTETPDSVQVLEMKQRIGRAKKSA